MRLRAKRSGPVWLVLANYNYMMDNAIRGLADQFSFSPRVINEHRWHHFSKFMVCGMGGSALSALLIKSLDQKLDIQIHRDYGLPALASDRERMVVLVSYSGNTEETISAYVAAKERGLPRAVVAVGGRLLEMAMADEIPYIVLPDTGIQPRNALGFMTKALLVLMGQNQALKSVEPLVSVLNQSSFEQQGRALAARLKNKIPIIYASTNHESLAYVWKIKFNETGKVPAFTNVFPELNHNEMEGFAEVEKHSWAQQFYFIFLEDALDSLRVKKRMQITLELLKAKKLAGESIVLEGPDMWAKYFGSIMVADWAAFYLATGYNVDPELVRMVESLKKKLVDEQ